VQSHKIVVAGASGYIGRAIIPKLLKKFPAAEITALSRIAQNSDDPRVIWKACDLFSLKSVELAIGDQVDLALYLVHSMGPTAQLDQGSFADYDLILADNFARVLKKLNVKQLIYLGGLIPPQESLSLHLRSRLEMEEIFSEAQIPLTVFRAGLILGENGSSSQILLKLVKRLPVMICPRWTQNLTTPVSLDEVLETICESALAKNHLGKIYDLAGCKPLTYLEMMKETAIELNKKRFFFKVPFFTPTLSRFWVSLITNTPKALVYPLIESLEHPMVARASHKFKIEPVEKNYSELIKTIPLETRAGKSLFHYSPQRRTVRSVQRLHLPQGKTAEWIKNRYAHWLPQFFSPMIKVKLNEGIVAFCLPFFNIVLLELKLSPDRSHVDRQLLYIIKGLLVAEQERGRLEFRVVLNRQYVLAAIHDYRPALPWFIYRYTQAKIHLFVMNAFQKYLIGR
jgi:uncharacterized protein YbjT (DUF2867 family)